MITPERKADQLIRRFTLDFTMDFDITKQCALIAVDEILDAIDWDYYEGSDQTEHNYWKGVKKVIEKL